MPRLTLRAESINRVYAPHFENRHRYQLYFGGAGSVWTRTCNAESPSNANRVARICTAEGESSSTSPTNTRGVAPVICI